MFVDEEASRIWGGCRFDVAGMQPYVRATRAAHILQKSRNTEILNPQF